MTITYIILPSVVKERMSLHANVDDKLIYPEIRAVQDMYILPLLGTRLFKKILTDIAGNNLAGDYKTLVDDYLVMCVCNYVMSELPEALNYQYWNSGVAQKTPENSSQPTMSEMYSIVAKYKSRAEHYAQMTRKYLIQNASAKFPEYLSNDSGVDIVIPEQDVYTCPIYLGPDKPKPKNYSNDPY